MNYSFYNDNNQKNTGFAENLVNHLMMFTGYKTAEYFYKNNLPFVYRCHQIDHKWNEYLEQCMRIQDEEVYKNMLKEIKGKIPKSYYSSENIGHFGLKIPNYSHITSPLRRFCDILNMHCINTCYFKIPTDKQIYQLEREVKVTAEYLNMQNNSIEEYLNKGKIKIK